MSGTDNSRSKQYAYLAGVGMITPVGANTVMTTAAVNAGINQYTISEYLDKQDRPITTTAIPEGLFTAMQIEIDEGQYYSEQFDHIIKMAIIAAGEAVAGHRIEAPIPLILAMPEPQPEIDHIESSILISNLVNQAPLPLSVEKSRCIHTGRAAGIQGLDLAMRYLYEADEEYVLLGGSDSYLSYPRLDKLSDAQRLLVKNSDNGFAPGEGAGFLLLTRNPEKAHCHEGHIIALCSPGEGEEPGYFSSDQPYKGEGLDQAFKQALQGPASPAINSVYSSMNGEHFWAKEYGVAMMRNKAYFHDKVSTEHPADCYGDLGSATGPVLIGLAAERLFKQVSLDSSLVYSSSDNAWRAAVRIDKVSYAFNREATYE